MDNQQRRLKGMLRKTVKGQSEMSMQQRRVIGIKTCL